MVGRTLAEQGITAEPVPRYVSVKESGLPVRQVPGRGHRARPRDAVDRRGDGDRHATSPAAFAKSQLGGVQPAADERDGLRERRRARPQGDRARSPPQLAAMGYNLMCTGGTAAALAEHGIAVDDRPQDPRGPAEPARPPGQRRDRPDRQHAQRQGRPDRRGPHPRRRRQPRRALHHHDRRRPGGRRRPGAAAGGDAGGLCAAGLAARRTPVSGSPQ